FLLRPEKPIRLHQLPGMLDSLAEDHITRARMRVAPASQRVFALGKEIGHGCYDLAQPGFIRREWRQFGQASQCVTDNIRFGIAEFHSGLVIVNKGEFRGETLTSLVE